MKRTTICFLTGIYVLSLCWCAQAGLLDGLSAKLKSASTTSLSDTQIGAGLKEALSVGIKNTIALLGKQDGYLGNPAVKILLPAGIQKADPLLRKAGFGPKLDEFVLSMNRAAEKATPLAADIFASALTDMSFADAEKILKGGNTAATDYFKATTSKKLLQAFQPTMHTAMDNYAVTKNYEDIMGKLKTIPLAGTLAGKIDIEHYVASKALDGLFTTLGQQEAKIRTDPQARVTTLLQDVFK
jgi:hypothetical protein